MQRIFIILLFAYYSMGTLLLPMGDLSYLQDMPKKYQQCQQEDWDLTPCDFVFEHLMNLEEVIDLVAPEKSTEKDKPHQSDFTHVNPVFFSVSSIAVITPSKKEWFFRKKEKYARTQWQFISSDFLSNVFRPPIV